MIFVIPHSAPARAMSGCRARGARLPLFRGSQFHASAALISRSLPDRSDVLNAKLLGAPLQEFIELRLGAHGGRGCDGADALLRLGQFRLDHAPSLF
jgi:hypothetical protein